MGLFRRKTTAEKAAEGKTKVEQLKADADIEGLVALLRLGKQEEELSDAAALALATLDDRRAMRILASCAESVSDPGREAARRALPAARGPVAADWLLEALGDPEEHRVMLHPELWLWQVSIDVAPDRVLDLVEASLGQSPQHDYRAIYLSGLSRLDDERSLEILRKAAAHEAQHLRQAAVDALAKRGDAGSLRIVSGSPEVRALIAELSPDLEKQLDPVQRLRWKHDGIPPDPQSLRPTADPEAVGRGEQAVGRLVELGEEAVEPLRRELHRTTYAYAALGKIGGEAALDELRGRLTSEDPREVLAAVRALGYLGDERALDDLRRLSRPPVSAAAPMSAIPEIEQAIAEAQAAVYRVSAAQAGEAPAGVEEEPVESTASSRTTGGEMHEAATVAGARTCAGCGVSILATDEFAAAAREVGFDVDPFTGDATYTLSGVFSGVGELARTESERQRLYDAVETRRAYVCRACGKAHCTGCLMSAPRQPATGGPRCPSCGEGPHRVLDE